MTHPQLPLLPNPTYGLSVCLDDNRLYIIGGSYRRDGVACKKVAYLQSGTDRWVSVSPMNIARKFSAVCALDHFIYVMGGDCESSCSSLERYNPTTNTWELLSSDIGLSVGVDDRLTAFNGHLYYLAHSEKIKGGHYYNFGKQYDLSQNKMTSNIVDENRILRTVVFIDKPDYVNRPTYNW